MLTVGVVLLTERKGRFALVISFPLLERRSQRTLKQETQDVMLSSWTTGLGGRMGVQSERDQMSQHKRIPASKRDISSDF